MKAVTGVSQMRACCAASVYTGDIDRQACYHAPDAGHEYTCVTGRA